MTDNTDKKDEWRSVNDLYFFIITIAIETLF